MDKDVTKRLLRDAGLNIAPFITLTRANRHNISFAEVESKLGLPLFVKPANQGSSVGVSKVTSEEQYAIAVDLAFEFDHKVIVEQGIKGREIECAVLGNDNPQASTCGEIVLTSDFYAYDTKYIDEDGAKVVVPAAIAPEIKNCIIVGFGENGTETSLEIPAISENQEIIAVYKRLACTLTYICKDSKGNPLETKSVDCELNQDVTITYPEIKYFSFASSDWKGEETFKPTKDETIQVVYTTDGLTGYKAAGSKVTKIEDGRQYLFFNTANDANRNGYLNLSKTNQIITSNVDKGTPAFVWNVTADEENTFRISNEYNELLIPSLPNGANVTASTNGDRFEFTLNADGSTWTIKGSNGQYWNGNAGAFTGWTDAHPYTIYEVVNVPYFEINIEYTDTLGNALSNLQPIKQILIAGSAYELNIPEVEGFTYLRTEGDAEQLKDLSKNVSIKVIYKEDEKTGINQVEDETGNDTLYDLEGRKLNDAKTRKGIYIRNGEKIIKQ